MTTGRARCRPTRPARDRIGHRPRHARCSSRPGPARARPPRSSSRVVALVATRRRRAAQRSPPSPSPRRRRRAARPDPPASCERSAPTPRRTPTPRPRRCRDALDQLDGAAIGTLHAFAQRILSEHPIEAGLPPRVEVLDEVSSGVEFERRWAAFHDDAARRPGLERTLLLLVRRRACSPRACACSPAAFDRQLGPRRRAGRRPTRPSRRRSRRASRAVLARSTTACRRAATDCADADDKLLAPPRRARRLRRRRCAAIDDELDLLELRRRAAHRAELQGAGNIGQQGQLGRRHRRRPGRRRHAAAPAIEQAGRRSPRPAPTASASAIRALHPRRGRTSAAPAGQLEFHDLLVLARALLRRPGARRRRPRAAAPALPAAAARRVPGHRPDPDRAGRAHRRRRPEADAAGPAPWDEVAGRARPPVRRRRPEAVDLPVPPGRHRACSSQARDRFAPTAAALVELTANFRTGRAGDRVGQRTCSRALMAEPPEVDAAGRLAARLRRARTPRAPAPPVGPAVSRRRAASAHPTRRSRRRAAGRRGRPTVAASRRPRPRRGLGGRRRREPERRGGRPALGDISDPRAGPHLAAVPRGRARRRRHPVPGRVELARLRHPRRPRPADGAAGRRRPDRPAAHRRRAAHAAVRLRRRRPVPLQGRAARPLGLPRATQPATVPADDPVASRARLPARRCTDAAPLGRARRAARPHRPRPPGLRARLRRGPAARRVAPAAVRHRPGPGLERGHRRQPARSTCAGSSCRRPRAPGWPSRCCPRPTTTPCAS